MAGFSPKRSADALKSKISKLEKKEISATIGDSLQGNVGILKELFADIDLLNIRFFRNNRLKTQKFCIAYYDGLVNFQIINDNVIKPIQIRNITAARQKMMDYLVNCVITAGGTKKTNQYREITDAITHGGAVLFAEGENFAVILNTKGFETRGIAEPESERIVLGPHEGFTESLVTNLSLIQRKVCSNELKIKYYNFGKITNTRAGICYIESVVNKDILKELYRRLDRIDIDGTLDTNYIKEFIRDVPYTPFRLIGSTERPDAVAGKLLEGRIALVLDGTPVVITLPYLFIENFQSGEDYYLNFFFATFTKILRILSFFITISIVGFYVAMSGFHHEVMPTPFLLNVASERNSVPLPAAFEAIVMLFVFEILLEAGARMPSNIGQAISIVGAIVIGQAAVEAKIVASPMIIIVATSGITSLLIPKLSASLIYVRAFILLLSMIFGFIGTTLALSVVIIHLLSLHSFGIPHVSANGNLKFQKVKDAYIRAPWWLMRMRRPLKMTANQTRMKDYEKNSN